MIQASLPGSSYIVSAVVSWKQTGLTCTPCLKNDCFLLLFVNNCSHSSVEGWWVWLHGLKTARSYIVANVRRVSFSFLSLKLLLSCYRAPKHSQAVLTSTGAGLISPACHTRWLRDEFNLNARDSQLLQKRPVIIHKQVNTLVSSFKHYNSSEKHTASNYSTSSVVKEAVSMVILFTLNNALVLEMVFNNYACVFQNILVKQFVLVILYCRFPSLCLSNKHMSKWQPSVREM